MRWFITKKMLVGLIGLLVATIFILLLSGCASTNERSNDRTVRTQLTERHPTADGGYREKVTEYIDGSSEKLTKTQADIDWSSAISKGVGAAVTGDWTALGGIAGTMLMAGGAAYVQHRRTVDHRNDAIEGWAKYEAAMKDKSNG